MDEAGVVAGLDRRNGLRQPPSAGSTSAFKHGFNGLKRIKRIGAGLANGSSAPIRLIRFNPLNPCKIFTIAPQSDNYSRTKRHREWLNAHASRHNKRLLKKGRPPAAMRKTFESWRR